MAKIRVELEDIAEDAAQVTFNGVIDVLDTALLATDVDGDQVPFTITLTDKKTASSWYRRLGAAVLSASGPLAGIVQAQYLAGGANVLPRARVRITGLPTTATVYPAATVIGSPVQFVNRQGGGRTIGVADAFMTADLPDDTIVRLSIWYAARRGGNLTVRLSARPRTSTTSWNYLNGMQLTLAGGSSPEPAQAILELALSSFGATDQANLRNCGGFRLYTVGGTESQQLTIFHASVSFEVPD